MEWIRNIFKKQSPAIYIMANHCDWGDNISFIDESKKRVMGHLFRKPEEGDYLYINLGNERIIFSKMVNIKTFRDPKDRFFADLEPIRII